MPLIAGGVAFFLILAIGYANTALLPSEYGTEAVLREWRLPEG